MLARVVACRGTVWRDMKLFFFFFFNNALYTMAQFLCPSKTSNARLYEPLFISSQGIQLTQKNYAESKQTPYITSCTILDNKVFYRYLPYR